MRIVRVAPLILLLTGLYPQDLQTAWENYASSEVQLQRALAREAVLVERRIRIQQEVQALQERQSWYGGWIIKMVLARKSKAEVELADSLQAVRDRIHELMAQREVAFLALKRGYEKSLLESQGLDSLSLSAKRHAISLGRWIVNRSLRPVDLPDYSPIVAGHFEHKKIRRVVLADLRSLLEAKLTLIDSLLNERRLEIELVDRLNEFHRDLGLQVEADRDLGSGRVRGSIAAEIPGAFVSGENYDVSMKGGSGTPGGGRLDLKRNQTPSPMSPSGTGPKEELQSRLGVDSLDDDVAYLESKRHQYQELLHKIEKELVY